MFKPNGDHEGQNFFYPAFTQIMDSFSCSPLSLFILKKAPRQEPSQRLYHVEAHQKYLEN